MRCRAAGYNKEKLQREARDLVLGHTNLLLHSLFCEACDARETALGLLAVAGQSEDDFLSQVWQEICGE